MALEGTHIRFALDVKDILEVKNVGAYLAGSVYPDSRLVTHTARTLTHDPSFLERSFYEHDDFKKGWMTHVLFDRIQYKAILKTFSTSFTAYDVQSFDENWVTLTAIKHLQDIHDIGQVDIRSFLPASADIIIPNAEKIEDLEKYYGCVTELYSNRYPSMENYQMMCVTLFGNSEIFETIRTRADQLLADPSVMQKISGLYAEILETCLNCLKKETVT
jgi:hypothetical protein